MSAFFVTVGTGFAGNITDILIQTVREANPNYCLLIATALSRPEAEKVVQKLGRPGVEIYQLESSEDRLEDLYQEIRDVIARRLTEWQVRPEDATADFTTGTKPMSAALVLTAVNLGIEQLKYIMAERGEGGRPLPGTESTYTFRPRRLQASLLLQRAVELLRRYRFDTVIQLLDPIPDYLLSETEQLKRSCLLGLARAYADWDIFQHIRFKNQIDAARPGRCRELAGFTPSAATVSTVMQLGQALQQGRLCDLAIVDLINNAWRRIEEGKYDDATARLYRACEMLAQWQLQELGIDTADVRLDLVPEKSRGWLENYRDGEKPIMIPLQAAGRLLEEIGKPFGRRFRADKKLAALLRTRNFSILAHGITPVSLETARELHGLVEQYARDTIADFENKSRILRFPWSCC